MTKYMLEVDRRGKDDGGPVAWDIRVGLNTRWFFLGYFLTIEDYDRGADELEDYIFHNFRDVPGRAMTLPGVESTLSRFGIGLPQQLAARLVIDGVTAGYLRELDGNPAALRAFREFEDRAFSDTWTPLGEFGA